MLERIKVTNKKYLISFVLSLSIIAVFGYFLVNNFGKNEKPGEWQHYRFDLQNTGQTDAISHIINPEIQWEIPLGVQVGLTLAFDLTNNGKPEIITLTSGALSAYDNQGSFLWRSDNHQLRSVIGVYDLDDNGQNEIILTAPPSDVVILSSKDGSLLFRQSLPDSAGEISYQNVRIGKVAPSQSGLQMVTWVPYNNTGLVWTFENGVEAGEVYLELVSKPEKGDPISYPSLSLVDIDNNGVLDITTPGWAQLYVFCGETGEQKHSVYWLTGNMNKRNYGHIAWANIDEDPYPEAVVLASSVVKHFAVIDNNGGELSLLWDHFFEDVFYEDKIDIRQVMNSVVDLNDNDRAEIVVSIFNLKGDEKWVTMILNPLIGIDEPLQVLHDHYLWAVEDLNGDGNYEILTSIETSRQPSTLSTLVVHRYDNGKWTSIVEKASAHFIEQSHRSFPDNVSSQSVYARKDIFVATLNESKKFGVYYRQDTTADGVHDTIAFWDPIENIIIWEAPTDNIGSYWLDIFISENETTILSVLPSGEVGILNNVGKIIAKFSSGSFSGVIPLVADLDQSGSPEIITLTASGEVTVFKQGLKEHEVLWSQPGYGRAIYNRNKSVFLADLTGDGNLEILFGQNINDTPTLKAVDHSGSIVWSYKFEGFPAGNSATGGLYEWSAGEIDDQGTLGVFVALSKGGNSAGEVFSLDGRTGELIWQTTRVGTYNLNPDGVFAFYDVNNNGRDEIIIISKNILTILDSQSGEPYEPFMFTTMDVARYGFAAYGSPIIIQPDQESNPGLLLAGNFGGVGFYDFYLWPLWWVDANEFETHGRFPGIGDLDSNGTFDVAINFSDGRIGIYNAKTGLEKWTINIESITNDFISADINGDGSMEFITTTLDGRLMALNTNVKEGGHILWELNIGGELNSPILADANGDGFNEILFIASNGVLYAIR